MGLRRRGVRVGRRCLFERLRGKLEMAFLARSWALEVWDWRAKGWIGWYYGHCKEMIGNHVFRKH
jgi:hypothetical protein